MPEPVIVRARAPEDADDFVNLLLMSAPEFFPALYGDTFDRVIRGLFRRPVNTFSYEHVDIVKADGKTAGMVLGYDWSTNKSEGRQTGMVMFRYMGLKTFSRFKHMLWVSDVLIKMEEGTFYVSNIAVYPQFRRRGVATLMLKHCENLARSTGNTKIALDVETCHEPAMQLYRGFGMKIVGGSKRTTIDGQDFEFVRMEKAVS